MEWYMTFVAGAMLTFFHRNNISVFISFIAGALGWGGPILFMTSSNTLVPFAEKIGGIFGLSGFLAIFVVLLIPFLLGGLLAVSGSLLLLSIKSLMSPLWANQFKGIEKPNASGVVQNHFDR
jgi:hypothetical protein